MHRLTRREFDLIFGVENDDDEIYERDGEAPVEPAVPSSLKGMFGG
jgi:hypothetical protein